MGVMDSMMNAMMGSMSPNEKQDSMLKMMPGMMKGIKGSEIADLIKKQIFKTMFLKFKSRFEFAETVQKIKESGLEFGWYNPIVTNHYEIEQDLGLADPNKSAMISMCIPRSAYKILKENKQAGAFMPMQINVYEEEGQVYVSWFNIEMMGKMIGPVTAEVMKSAAAMLMDAHKNIIINEEVSS